MSHIHLRPQAPGEAEAELASLNAKGYIDAVYTDDGDTFVFGGKRVIRMSVFIQSLSLPLTAAPARISRKIAVWSKCTRRLRLRTTPVLGSRGEAFYL